MIVADFNKHNQRKDTAAMLSSYRDELEKLSTSLPRVDTSFFMHMFPYLGDDAKTLNKQIESAAQYLSEVRTFFVDRTESKKKVSERLKRIHLSDEKRSLHFVQKQKEYEVEVSEKLLELEEWYDDFMTFEGRTPDELEFSKKLNEIKDELKELDSRINTDLFFKDGSDDVVLCGRILIKNEINWDSAQEKQAVCLFSAFQWIICKRNDTLGILSSDTQEELKESWPGVNTETVTVLIPIASQTAPIDAEKEEHLEVDEMDAELKEAYLTLREIKDEESEKDKYTLGHIYTTLRYMCCKREKKWAKTNRAFSKHFAPLIGVSSHSVDSAISRVANQIKDISLDDMTRHIAKLKADFPLKKFDKEQLWVDIYEDALQLISITPSVT